MGVSRDPQETSDRFRESLGLPYPMLGDPDGKILSAYGVRWPLIGLARRVTYVIGPSPRIREVIRGELDADRHVEEACALVR